MKAQIGTLAGDLINISQVKDLVSTWTIAMEDLHINDVTGFSLVKGSALLCQITTTSGTWVLRVEKIIGYKASFKVGACDDLKIKSDLASVLEYAEQQTRKS